MPSSDGRFLENPKPLECSLERIKVVQRTQERGFSQRFKTNTKLTKSASSILDNSNSGFSPRKSTTFGFEGFNVGPKKRNQEKYETLQFFVFRAQ
ncbi:hypothetical protein B9Q02_03760 [Candidatus Marsarchaeota G1 archaeon BE_D]|uniref:Uncharacterized protein n=1 Tax=Candidatus Marsarchaeota G1 archaeon BE_D TaxID=1978156 RepID=A0A2R6AI92_9ARCH|nr:MAG: hypothetical protein B9Q02_03760 [Candidatus Marsarchaeota G1 archaeon BE_D]